MADHSGWVNIDEIIANYLDRSEQSIHKYKKCWHLAHSGMKQLGLDFFNEIRTVKLPILSNKTCTLPSDYLQYAKVGIFNGRGEIIPFRYNATLTTFADLQTNRQGQTETNNFYGNYNYQGSVFYNYWSGGGFTNLYGLPSGSPYTGTFKIDDTNGIILLGESYTWPYLAMEYVASPAEGGNFYVPSQFEEALLWFIAWHDISLTPNSRKSGLGDKEQRKKNYYNERRLALARYKPFYLADAYIQSQLNSRLTVKS